MFKTLPVGKSRIIYRGTRRGRERSGKIRSEEKVFNFVSTPYFSYNCMYGVLLRNKPRGVLFELDLMRRLMGNCTELLLGNIPCFAALLAG
jgi:hypothetical protein